MADQARAGGTQEFRHAALVYRAPGELADAVRRFVDEARGAGAAVLVTMPPSSLTQLRPMLDGPGSQVSVADMADAGANPGRLIAMMRIFAEEHRGQSVRIVSEPVWTSRSPDEVAEAVRHEALLNLAMAGTAVTALCAYDARLAAGVLASAAQTHPAVLHDGVWQPSPGYRTDQVYPDGYDLPLSAPPDSAVSMSFRDEQEMVRGFAADEAGRAGLAPRRIVDVIIAAGELAGNTIAHTSGAGTITTWGADGEFVFQITDGGRLQNPLAGRIRPDPASIGRGRGLWVVHQVSDLFEVRSAADGNTFRVHFRF